MKIMEKLILLQKEGEDIGFYFYFFNDYPNVFNKQIKNRIYKSRI